MHFIRLFGVVCLLFLFSGCNDGGKAPDASVARGVVNDSSSAGGGSAAADPNISGKPIILYDQGIVGLGYLCLSSNGLLLSDGKTDTAGEHQCPETTHRAVYYLGTTDNLDSGGIVEVEVGRINLGEYDYKTRIIVTPVALVTGSRTENNIAAQYISAILHALDADGIAYVENDPTNTIQIPAWLYDHPEDRNYFTEFDLTNVSATSYTDLKNRWEPLLTALDADLKDVGGLIVEVPEVSALNAVVLPSLATVQTSLKESILNTHTGIYQSDIRFLATAIGALAPGIAVQGRKVGDDDRSLGGGMLVMKTRSNNYLGFGIHQKNVVSPNGAGLDPDDPFEAYLLKHKMEIRTDGVFANVESEGYTSNGESGVTMNYSGTFDKSIIFANEDLYKNSPYFGSEYTVTANQMGEWSEQTAIGSNIYTGDFTIFQTINMKPYLRPDYWDVTKFPLYYELTLQQGLTGTTPFSYRIAFLANGDIVSDLNNDCSVAAFTPGSPGSWSDENGVTEYIVGTVGSVSQSTSGATTKTFATVTMLLGNPAYEGTGALASGSYDQPSISIGYPAAYLPNHFVSLDLDTFELERLLLAGESNFPDYDAGAPDNSGSVYDETDPNDPLYTGVTWSNDYSFHLDADRITIDSNPITPAEIAAAEAAADALLLKHSGVLTGRRVYPNGNTPSTACQLTP